MSRTISKKAIAPTGQQEGVDISLLEEVEGHRNLIQEYLDRRLEKPVKNRSGYVLKGIVLPLALAVGVSVAGVILGQGAVVDSIQQMTFRQQTEEADKNRQERAEETKRLNEKFGPIKEVTFTNGTSESFWVGRNEKDPTKMDLMRPGVYLTVSQGSITSIVSPKAAVSKK